MTRSPWIINQLLAAQLTEALKLIQGVLRVASKVQHGIKQGACMTIGENKSITVPLSLEYHYPERVSRTIVQES
jgi:hypothetical protein